MKIKWIESCGSTNEELKKELRSPLPPAIAALEQTAGKGRIGRSFASAKGAGLYISIPLEIECIEGALPVMPMAAVCVARAIDELCGVKCDIKWPNDLLYEGRKLCGILTELVSVGNHIYLALGIGINLTQRAEDFPEEIRENAVSLLHICGESFSPQEMAAALLPQIEDMIKAIPENRDEYLKYYREHCITTGKNISVIFSGDAMKKKGKALEITSDFALLVQWEDSQTETLKTGEVSIRI